MTMDPSALMRRFVEDVWSKGDVSVLHEIVSKDFVGHVPLATDLRGADAFGRHVETFRVAFPDWDVSIIDIGTDLGQGQVFVRWIGRGTHKGTLCGMGPTNRKAIFEGIAIGRIDSGRLTTVHARFDTLDLMQQLGFVPPLERMASARRASIVV